MTNTRIYPYTKELNPRDIYKHTRARGKSINDDVKDGDIIKPSEIVMYEDVNDKGEVIQKTSIVDGEGVHYVTSSKTFNKELDFILDLMKDEEFSIKVLKPKSKGGRTYLTCELI